VNDPILFWNAVTLEVHRRDFTFNGEGDRFATGKLNPEQAGPTRVSRSFAMVHIAMYEAYARSNPTAGLTGYTPLAALPAAPAGAEAQVSAGAVAGAAISVLKSQWPRQAAYIEQQLLQAPGSLSDADFIVGVGYGNTVGAAMLKLRQEIGSDGLFVDGSQVPDNMVFDRRPGHHRPDPFAPNQGRLSTNWGSVTPFCISAVGAGDPPIHTNYIADYPQIGTKRYESAAVDVLGKGKSSNSTRTNNETVAGIYWGYDGPRGLGVPPRLYNQMVRKFSEDNTIGNGLPPNTPAENATLFALINAGMADAAIVAWSAKYHYDLWRPVVGIREHDPGFGMGHRSHPSTLDTSASCDPTWAPLGRPGTNTPGDFTKTPDFPAYPSGHATFGAVAFRLTAKFFARKLGRTTSYAMNELFFRFTSDEFNGINQDPHGDVRVYHERTFNLVDAIVENALSRVYLGVHWRFDGLGTVAPDDLEGAIPSDPASGSVVVGGPDEKKLGGVPIGLKIAGEIFGHFGPR